MAATWQAGDNYPPIRFTITTDDGPLDLTTVTVKFRFAVKGQTAAWERDCVPDEPKTAGKCHLEWQSGDLAVSGDYEGQLVITLNGEIRLSPPFEILVLRSVPPAPEPEP